MMKLLITSVGSLVGQNILDVLEWPGCSRRSLVRVVGTNSQARAPGNFRCDRCYLVPQTAAAKFRARMREILMEEAPDLILCSRDEDTLALSELRAEQPDLPGALPVGSPQAALIGLDKWQTWLFSRRHGLPFAESFMPGQSGDGPALDVFCRRVGYPVIAKPVRGYASRGVHFVRSREDAESMRQRQGYIFQEYLGDPQSLEPYFEALRGPPPLFAQSQDTGHHTCQTVIAPNGDIAPIFILFNQLEHGMPLLVTRVSDSSLEASSMAFARALAIEGVVGPVIVDFRRDRQGNWKVPEINLRNAGSTLSRFLLGRDELYLIVRAFLPHVSFPELTPAQIDRPDHVGRYLSSHPFSDRAVETLNQSGVWSRSPQIERS